MSLHEQGKMHDFNSNFSGNVKEEKLFATVNSIKFGDLDSRLGNICAITFYNKLRPANFTCSFDCVPFFSPSFQGFAQALTKKKKKR